METQYRNMFSNQDDSDEAAESDYQNTFTKSRRREKRRNKEIPEKEKDNKS